MRALLDVQRQTSIHNVAMPCAQRDSSSPATFTDNQAVLYQRHTLQTLVADVPGVLQQVPRGFRVQKVDFKFMN